jgi:4-amino-4-deoxy-L-arabinose transferase-like glycosyltransferase
MSTQRRLIVYICLFGAAFGIRLLVWQNNTADIDVVQNVVTHVYKQDARLLAAGDIRGFITGPDPPTDATIIMHPPGYPIFIAAVHTIFGEGNGLRIIQLLLNSLAPLLLFAIAAELFHERIALISGLLAAISPQLAYHSAIILPDELSVLPILAAVYFLIRGRSCRNLTHLFLCGFFVGFSCWFRSNAMLLPIFLAAVFLLSFPVKWKLRPTIAIIAAFLLTIAPMTIRNYVVFGSFIPVSVGSGTTFLEGLGDIDNGAGKGMPVLDEDVMRMDASQFARPDYYGNLYAVDGIKRERNRIKTGLSVVAADPFWFLSGYLQRSLMVFRMERVPVIDPQIRGDIESSGLRSVANLLKLFQKTFVTPIILPLVLLGFSLLIFDKKQRTKVAILATVPVYFMTVQPLIHTEYRYLLPSTHILLIFSAVALSWFVSNIGVILRGQQQ